VQNPSVYISGRLAKLRQGRIRNRSQRPWSFTRVNEISSSQARRSRRCLWISLDVEPLQDRFEALHVEERVSLDQLAQREEAISYSIAPPPAASTAAATPPKRNAASAASATSAAAASMTASAASVAASAASVGVAAVAASVPDKLYAGLGRSDVFLIEDIERRQADVRDFLFTESDFVRCRPDGCSR
jgi:hypothetical protein